MDLVRAFTFGVEIEAVAYGVPKSDDACTYIAAILNGTPGITARKVDHGYTVPNPGDDSWLVTTDDSITPEKNAVELISPIMEDQDDVKWRTEIATVLTVLKHVELETNHSTGLHVHIGVGKAVDQVFTLAELRKIAAVLVIYEGSLDDLHEYHRNDNPAVHSIRNNRYLVRVPEESLATRILSAQSVEQLQGMVNPLTMWKYPPPGKKGRSQFDKQNVPLYSMRTYKVNFTSIAKHGTVEFRQHAGTVEPEAICAWVDFVLGLVKRALAFTDEEVNQLNAEKMPLVPTIVNLDMARAVNPYYDQSR